VVYDSEGRLVAGRGKPLGRATNNEAEYGGLLLGLELARELGARDLEIRADSELLVRQVRGEYRVRAVNLRGLVERARDLLEGFPGAELVAVPRKDNSRADRLANRAMDAGREVSEPAAPRTGGRTGRERSGK
jgi:ribonuclease HI